MLLERYERLIADGQLRADPDQRHAAERLNHLQHELGAADEIGLLSRLLGRRPPRPKGVYLWGGVGRGKSMLMDLFHATLPLAAKRRVHFHAFMQQVHEELHAIRARERGDPMPSLAKGLADGLRCLAFDELMVTNPADAMLMSRLFTRLIREEGLTVVATSNRPPRDLYKDGLNREHFLPFIALVEEEMEVIALDGPVDYRLQRIGGMPNWHYPIGPEATAKVRELFFRLTDFAPEDAVHVPSGELEVSAGRRLFVPKCLKGVAVFSFKKLCAEARGAADYLAIARSFHTVILVGIPVMGKELRNEAARFTALIDALYEYRVKLFVTAAAPPEQLYVEGDGSFEFARTVSRLNEMQSAQYMALAHGGAG